MAGLFGGSSNPPLFPEIQSGGIGGGTTGLAQGATTTPTTLAEWQLANPNHQIISRPGDDWRIENGQPVLYAKRGLWSGGDQTPVVIPTSTGTRGLWAGGDTTTTVTARKNTDSTWDNMLPVLVAGMFGAGGISALGALGAGAGVGEALPAGAGGAFDMGGLAGGVPGAGGATGFTTGIGGTYGFAGMGGLGLGAANAAGSGGVPPQSTGPGVTPGINGYNWQQLLGAGMTLKDILQLAAQGYGLYSSIDALGDRRDAEREMREAFNRSDPFAAERAAAGSQYLEWMQDPNKYMSSPIARLQIDELNRAARAKQSQLGTTWSIGADGNITGSGSGAADFAKQLQTNLASQYETALGNRAQQAGMSLFPSAAMAQNLAQIQGSEAGLRRDVATDVFKIGGQFADLYDKYFGA